jgi:hypothetical protein
MRLARVSLSVVDRQSLPAVTTTSTSAHAKKMAGSKHDLITM